MTAAAPLAHETWFVPDLPGGDASFATEPLTLALLAAAVLATLAVRLAARLFPGFDVPFLGRMAPYMPFAIRLHLAVSLIGLLSLGFYLSPTMDLQPNPIGIVLGVVMALVAIGMATGWHTREAAWLLILAGPLGVIEFSPLDVLQRIDLLGLAVFVLVTGPGRWSADVELGRAEDPPPALTAARATWALRVAAGTALIVVAFKEKLLDPRLALDLLADRPELNAFAQLGLPIEDLEFVRIAGAIEVLFGLLLISGALPQAVVLAAGLPFNATLFFFGNTELVGHLPLYGAMLALLVYGSDRELRPLVQSAWPWRRRPGRLGEPELAHPAPGRA